MTTPTISEGDAVNAPGAYEFLMDEDMTVTTGNLTEQMAFIIKSVGMQDVFLEIELFAPLNYGLATSAALAITDSVADAIKVKTDQLAFTGGNVNSDLKVVAGQTLQLAGVGNKNIGATS